MLTVKEFGLIVTGMSVCVRVCVCARAHVLVKSLEFPERMECHCYLSALCVTAEFISRDDLG